jgi:hypothetical protein
VRREIDSGFTWDQELTIDDIESTRPKYPEEMNETTQDEGSG